MGLALAFAALMQGDGGFQGFYEILAAASANAEVTIFAGIAILLLIIAVSYRLSLTFYKRREF